jgi:hypothetical protein
MPSDMSDTAPSLGQLINVYRPSHRRRVLAWVGLAASLGAGIISASAGGYRWYLATTQYGPAVVGRWSTPWFIAAAAFAGLGLTIAILLWRSRRLEVGLYGAGLTYQRGRRRLMVPWQDIQRLHASAVRYGIFGLIWGGEMQVRLDLKGGQQVRLTRTLADLPDLVEKIKRNIYPHLLANYTRAFNQGQALEFGPLTLNGDGVARSGRLLPWVDLASADLDRGVLRLTPAQGASARRMRIPAHQIPNFDVCLQLIQNLGQRA